MPAPSLSRRVLRYIVEHHLTQPGQTIVVGVSGGPDSVCLVHLLNQLKERLAIVLHGAHLNHALRGADADADAAYVADLLSQLGIPATIDKKDVADFRRRHHLSLEAAARQVRYAFLAQVAREVGAAAVAVGHTADDQVETLLLHLLRGSGLAGLAGMRPQTELRPSRGIPSVTVVRPLLEMSRAETVAYCQAHGLTPRQDSSNLSTDARRNRLRHRVIPLLEEINPALRRTLGRAAALMADDLAFLEAEAGRLLPQMAEVSAKKVTFARASLLRLSPPLRRHLLRRGVHHLWGDLVGLEAAHILAMERALVRGAGRQIALPQGLVFTVEHEAATLAPEEEATPLEGEFPLRVPGPTQFSGWQVEAQVGPPQPEDQKRGGLSASLDLAACGPELWVRRRRPGDRFHPLGLAQPKKLQDFLVDAHIPRRHRDALPLVVSSRGIVWVVDHRIAEWAKVTPHTEQVLRLDFRPT